MVLEQLGALLNMPAKQSGSSEPDGSLSQRIRLLMAAMSNEVDDRSALNLASIGLNSGT